MYLKEYYSFYNRGKIDLILNNIYYIQTVKKKNGKNGWLLAHLPYVIFDYIVDDPVLKVQFLKLQNQKKVLMKLATITLSSTLEEKCYLSGTCGKDLIIIMYKSFSNILLNNFTKLNNGCLSLQNSANLSKKRKL